jgi:RNA polymerase sigma-70 factor, ECF subfamily
MPALANARPTVADVFEAHIDYVWRVLRHMGVAPRDLEDVAQEVFVVVHRRLAEWEPRGDIRSWLYAIAAHAAKDHRRRAWNRRVGPLEEQAEPHGSETTEDLDDRLDARRALERVHAALSALPEEQRMVFVLYELEGLSMEEITQGMQCPLKTTYSRLRLAREAVRTRAAEGGSHGR